MIMIKNGDKLERGTVRARLRFDIKGLARPARIFFGFKKPEEVAAENREKQLVALRCVPIQGIVIEQLEREGQTYTIKDPVTGEDVAFAPVELLVHASSIEDLVRFALREEFRKIDILEPKEMFLSHYDAEKMLYQVGEEMRLTRYFSHLEGKGTRWEG
jgi:hypothetical protein